MATSFYNAGVLLFSQGEMDSLLAALAKPLQNMPDQAILHNLAGRANLVKGNTEKAILEFKEFLRLDPDAPEAPDIKGNIEAIGKGKPGNNRPSFPPLVQHSLGSGAIPSLGQGEIPPEASMAPWWFPVLRRVTTRLNQASYKSGSRSTARRHERIAP